jgi:hypothetical protein
MESSPVHQPDLNRLSVLLAMVLLTYAVTPFIKLPAREVTMQLPGIFISLNLGFATLNAILAGLLAGLGSDWLLRAHPRYAETRSASHWLLPALTAMVIGVPLDNLKIGGAWWAVFALGGFLLAGVCVAEYIASDPADLRRAPVTAVLAAVSFALVLVLAVALRGASTRLFLIIPALAGAVFLTALRTLYLRLGDRWVWTWSLGIALVVGEMAAGLYYWPISPLQYGLILMGPAYAATSLAAALEEGRTQTALWLEPALMLAAFWSLAALIR